MSIWDSFFGKSTPIDLRPPTYKCKQCGAVLYVGMQHYCGVLSGSKGAKVATPITEDDVRRIIREELAAVGKSGSQT